MTLCVEVKPELLRWACERNGVGTAAFIGRFPKLDAWVSDQEEPTLTQLESFAREGRDG